MPDAKKEEKAKAQPVKETKQESAAPPAEGGKHSKNKISRMNLAAIEKALEQTQKQMGGLTSHYGRTLQARKAFLSQQRPGGKR